MPAFQRSNYLLVLQDEIFIYEHKHDVFRNISFFMHDIIIKFKKVVMQTDTYCGIKSLFIV